MPILASLGTVNDRAFGFGDSSFKIVPGKANFSIEAFFYPTGTTVTSGGNWNPVGGDVAVSSLVQYTPGDHGFYIAWLGNKWKAYSKIQGNTPGSDSGISTYLESNDVLSPNTWYHVVFCRTGNVLSLFVDGTRVATSTLTYEQLFLEDTIYFGYENSAYTNYYAGNISNLRICTIISAYNATQTSITVPTAPLTAISGTQLLIFQDYNNITTDASVNNISLSSMSGAVTASTSTPFSGVGASASFNNVSSVSATSSKFIFGN